MGAVAGLGGEPAGWGAGAAVSCGWLGTAGAWPGGASGAGTFQRGTGDLARRRSRLLLLLLPLL